jgi:hypothetical protein
MLNKLNLWTSADQMMLEKKECISGLSSSCMRSDNTH